MAELKEDDIVSWDIGDILWEDVGMFNSVKSACTTMTDPYTCLKEQQDFNRMVVSDYGESLLFCRLNKIAKIGKKDMTEGKFNEPLDELRTKIATWLHS